MIKIAFIIDSIETPAAGTEKQLLMLINGLDKKKFKPWLFCLRDSEWLRNNTLPFPVYVFNVGSLLSLNLFRGLLKFKKFHRKVNFDIIQTFFADGNIFGSIVAWYIGCKKLISSRRNIGYWHNWIHIRILRLFAKLTPYYLCNSKAAKNKTIEIEKVKLSKIKIIYNGLNLDKFNSINENMRREQREVWDIDENELVIGTIANLRPIKNLGSLITVASALIKEFSNLKFIVVGEGKLRNKLQNKIDTLNMTKTFRLVGQVNNIERPLSAFDIAVMPSLSESFSNSLIEYMAARLPIISSDSGGNSEAIEHNKTGLLYSLDDKNGLSNALRQIILDKTFAGQLAENAHNIAYKNYNVNEMIINHQNYYNSIMEK